MVEYAEMLSQLCKKNGANVAILTDFDIDGLKIARTLSDIYRIGIDFDTLEYFKLKEECRKNTLWMTRRKSQWIM